MVEDYRPCAAMVATQFIYATMSIFAKEVFSQGMNPLIFVLYRQAFATLFLVPISILAKRGRMQNKLGAEALCLAFLAAFVGATVNQLCYYRGLELGSPSMAMAMANLIPALTFIAAVSLGLEKVKLGSIRSMAKIVGTAVCVSGAMTIAFFKGPKLLNQSSMDDKWIMGAMFLLGGTCCWTTWLLLQVPICKSHMDPLTLSTWMSFFSTLQSAVLAVFLRPDWKSWEIRNLFQLFACIFAGIGGSAGTFFLQSWCISVRGPLYSAMFSPLGTVITTVIATSILHEQLHIGSLIGGVAVISGLYIVLWGKSGDLPGNNKSGLIAANEHEETASSCVRAAKDEVGNDICQPFIADKV